jgi:hypothetical protein
MPTVVGMTSKTQYSKTNLLSKRRETRWILCRGKRRVVVSVSRAADWR